MVNLFLLTWNPTKWKYPDRTYQSEVRRTATGQEIRSQWSVGNRTTGIRRGDLALLVRQHDQRGIVGHGRFTSQVFQEPHWDDSQRTANYARWRIDKLVDVEDRLPVELLKREVPEIAWDRLQGSGVKVAADVAERLSELWDEHVGGGLFVSAEEVTPFTTYEEGQVTRVSVDRYERDRRARKTCIDHHGTRCSVCDVDFGDRYGPLGSGFIHVHHLVELSSRGTSTETDPIEDLRPVCPNCHAMLHRRRPAMSIEELRKIIGARDT